MQSCLEDGYSTKVKKERRKKDSNIMKSLSRAVGQVGLFSVTEWTISHKFFRLNPSKKFMLQLLYEGEIIFAL